MSSVNVNVVDEAGSNIDQETITQAVTATLDTLRLPRPAAVTIRLVGDQVMQELNKKHLGRTYPTDVLSFPIHPFDRGELPSELPDGPILLGEVVVNIDQAERQRKSAGHAFAREVLLLVEHGVQHLIGFHHS